MDTKETERNDKKRLKLVTRQDFLSWKNKLIEDLLKAYTNLAKAQMNLPIEDEVIVIEESPSNNLTSKDIKDTEDKRHHGMIGTFYSERFVVNKKGGKL